jgi:hypothetical protein
MGDSVYAEGASAAGSSAAGFSAAGFSAAGSSAAGVSSTGAAVGVAQADRIMVAMTRMYSRERFSIILFLLPGLVRQAWLLRQRLWHKQLAVHR